MRWNLMGLAALQLRSGLVAKGGGLARREAFDDLANEH